MAPRRTDPRRRPVNVKVLPSASNITITGGSFAGIQQAYHTQEISGPNISLEQLYARVASNAILNSGGRADEVRCYPGTREEVIGIIERWISGDGDPFQSIFWLSGPAGAGKSAIIQTIAERCIQRGTPMANYFFFRADSSRNTAGSVVATLLYQILQFLPALKEKITTLLEAKPLIFDESIQDQFKNLLDTPARTILNNSTNTRRLVLLIDGLDECDSETKRVQRDLLRALHHLVSEPGSPFIVLVASRAEPHLVMAFNEIGSSNDSIFLDENYRPSDDIRTFVAAEFARIKKGHHLRHTLGSNWPPEESIDAIVEKSSGQFIYAATVMRFISGSPASPAHSLERVRGIRPIVKSSPFAELDAIYTHILSQAEDWDLVKDILATQLLLPEIQKTVGFPFHALCTTIGPFLAFLGHSKSDIESCLSDLVAIVRYNEETERVIFYHASLQDFLRDKSRSNAVYVHLGLFAARLATAHMSAMSLGSTGNNVEMFCAIFYQSEIATPDLKDKLISWKPPNTEVMYMRGLHPDSMSDAAIQCIATLRKLYYKDDDLFYQAMLKKWLPWFFDLGIPLKYSLEARKFTEAEAIWDGIPRSRAQAMSKIRATRTSSTNEEAISKAAFWKRLSILETFAERYTEKIASRMLNGICLSTN